MWIYICNLYKPPVHKIEILYVRYVLYTILHLLNNQVQILYIDCIIAYSVGYNKVQILNKEEWGNLCCNIS